MKKILVCDDDQDILDLVTLVLEDTFQVTAEIDSTQLMQRAAVLKPDLILLDMWMPHLRGDQLTTALKKQPGSSSIPVVIFSASKDGREEAFSAGADAFLAKPFDIDELSNIAERYTKQSA
jgi:CheY-like chemotaxis protein